MGASTGLLRTIRNGRHSPHGYARKRDKRLRLQSSSCNKRRLSTMKYLRVLAIVLLAVPLIAADKVRIIQTNSAGDNVHIIDPATNKVVGEIKGIDVNHGAAAAPDGSRLYVTN